MSIYVAALLIGIVAGLRSMTPPAAVSWAARFSRLHLDGTRLAWLGYAVTPYLFTLAAIGELIADKLPQTPSRKAPMGLIARILSGALCGAAIGTHGGAMAVGLVLGVVGAIAGTLGGYEARVRLVRATGGKDFPIALLEDVVAVGGSILIVSQLP